MNFDSFINCLQLKTPHSGALIGYYDFESGDGKLFKNLIYENSGFYFTGLNSSGQQVTGIRSDLLPAVVFSDSETSFSVSGIFSGEDFVRIGRTITSEELSFFIRYDGNPCKSLENKATPQILLSSNASGFASGFNLGVNASNRLFFEYKSSGDVRIETFSRELSERNLVSFLLKKSSASFAVYNFSNEEVYQEDFPLVNFENSNVLYVGKDRFNTSATGLFGGIKNLAIFNEYISDEIKLIDECLFCSGYTVDHNETGYFTGYFLTGSYNPIIQKTGITGYQTVLTSFLDENGHIIYLSSESGITGIISTTTGYDYLTGSGAFPYEVFVSGEEFYDRESKRDYLNSLNYHFRGGSLSSGDYIQVYSYRVPIFDHSIKVMDLNYSPVGHDAVFLNGLLATSGKGFSIFKGLVNSGVDLDDSLRYDNLTSRGLTFDASGLWSSNRLLLNFCDVSTGANPVYFPSAAQFLETGNDTLSFTGFNGTGITGFDFYLNGQKLTNEYQTGVISGKVNYSLSSSFIQGWQGEVQFSGCPSPDGNYEVLSHRTFDTISFIPKISPLNLINQEKLYTGNASKLDFKISGYSEQIWLNGVRQFIQDGYNASYNCSLNDSFTDFEKMPLNFYNNENSLFNIE